MDTDAIGQHISKLSLIDRIEPSKEVSILSSLTPHVEAAAASMHLEKVTLPICDFSRPSPILSLPNEIVRQILVTHYMFLCQPNNRFGEFNRKVAEKRIDRWYENSWQPMVQGMPGSLWALHWTHFNEIHAELDRLEKEKFGSDRLKPSDPVFTGSSISTYYASTW